jgi:hypothetical protein
LIEGNNKYIKRYPEKDLVHILKDSKYHSSEWEETDPEEEVSAEATAEATEEATKKKTSLYIYQKWWRSSAVRIFYILIFIKYKC